MAWSACESFLDDSTFAPPLCPESAHDGARRALNGGRAIVGNLRVPCAGRLLRRLLRRREEAPGPCPQPRRLFRCTRRRQLDEMRSALKSPRDTYGNGPTRTRGVMETSLEDTTRSGAERQRGRRVPRSRGGRRRGGRL